MSEKHDKMVEIVKLERVVIELKERLNSLQQKVDMFDETQKSNKTRIVQ